MALAVVEDVVLWSSVYVYRIVVVLSLVMHLILAFFSESRRRDYYGWGKHFLWLAYQLTEWSPAYVIVNLYLETLPKSKMIIAFWVPFLLLHQARPDNISAYAKEDSETWGRNMLFAVLETLGSGCILYRFFLADSSSTGLLRPASCILMLLGMFRYLESAEALRRCNLGTMAGSFKQKKHRRRLRCSSSSNLELDGDEEAALLVAHDLFDVCKGAFCDYTADAELRDDARSMFIDRWKSMCTVVEMELSLMYDVLYTKSAVVHTWGGYAIRLASPPLTATALVLFILHCKEGMKGVDQAITYTLLSTTLLLDLRWLFRSLASTWTHSFFNRMVPCNWLKHEFWCRERWKKLRGFVMSLFVSKLALCLWTCPRSRSRTRKSYRRWADIVGQHNLLHKCTSPRKRRCQFHSISSSEELADDHHLEHEYYWEDEADHHLSSSGVEIPDYVKELVFSNICRNLFPRRRRRTESNGTTTTPRPPSPPGSSDDHDHEQSKQSFVPGPGLPDYHGSPLYGNRIGDEDEQTCVCVGINNQPPPSPETGLGIDDEVPTERTCSIGINIQLPPLLPPPCPRQIRVGMRLARPLEENQHDVSAWPYTHHHHPGEQEGAEHHWRYDYDQPQQAYDQADEEWIYHQNRSIQDRSDSTLGIHKPEDDDDDDDDDKMSRPGDDQEEFPPELQEVILIWHIVTDVFLYSCPRITQEKSNKLVTAIKIMSNYMVFLVAKRPEMLPGLNLRSLYRDTLDNIMGIKHAANKQEHNPTSSNRTSEKKELAKWMLTTYMMDGRKKSPAGTDVIWEGTRLARVLLTLVIQDEPRQALQELLSTVKKLEGWLPRLQELPEKLMKGTSGDMGYTLQFILEAWVRLLMYTSIRCSRDSHAKQLGRGGELTTLVWILAQHADDLVIKKNLPPLLPPQRNFL